MSHTASAHRLQLLLRVTLLFPVLWFSSLTRAQTGVEPDRRSQDRVVRLKGSPEELGRQHGRILRAAIHTMIGEYVEGEYGWTEQAPRMLERVRRMKPSLPDWYMVELTACAQAAGIDEDILLYAQAEGDIRNLGGCTTFVAFGEATPDGTMEIGRNFDYWGLEATQECVVILAVRPRQEDGHAFVSVGWAGILGGWTFFNDAGLFVANNLGGGNATNPLGIPTLILERMIAQKAASVEEALAILRDTPRMRGQTMVIGHTGTNTRPADAVLASYDAETVTVTRPSDGFVLHSSVGTTPDDIRAVLRRRLRTATTAIASAANSITLHSVAIRPQEGRMWVAHGEPASAHRGGYIRYDIRELLQP